MSNSKKENIRLKVCHIVSWYPNEWNDKEAIWTKRHIDGLNEFCDNDVFHVQIKYGKLGKHFYKISDTESAYIWTVNTNIWFIRELLTTLLLWYVLLFKIKTKKYAAFNFQITYPLLTYSRILTTFLKKPIIVTEHWSAYHLNFGVKKELKRVKRIFRNKKLHFICVSEALRNDIEKFSGEKINYKIVNNTVDDKFFKNYNLERKSNTFFMLSFWKIPKNPFLIIDVFYKLKSEGFLFHLVFGGFGPQIPEVKAKIDELLLNDEIDLIGALDVVEIVKQFNNASFFIHNSNYEVSSLVCMESVMCGTPVIASNVGGIGEYINESNGILVERNDFESWYASIKESLIVNTNFDHQTVSEQATKKFSKSKIAFDYYSALLSFIDKKNI